MRERERETDLEGRERAAGRPTEGTIKMLAHLVARLLDQEHDVALSNSGDVCYQTSTYFHILL